MSELLGRGVKFRVNGSVIMCFRSMSLTVNGEMIDITDSCSNGSRELLEDPAVTSVDIGIEAVAKQDIIRAAVLSATPGSRRFSDAELVWPHSDGSGSDGAILSGDFIIGTYSETIPYENVVTYSATLQSTGERTYTPEV